MGYNRTIVIEHRCSNCRQTVTLDVIPEDQLCAICWLISEADPREREHLATVFQRPIPQASARSAAPDPPSLPITRKIARRPRLLKSPPPGPEPRA